MRRLLQKVKEQPESVRLGIAIILALLITALVVAFWVWARQDRFEITKKETPEESKPFQLMFSSFKEAFSTTGKGIKSALRTMTPSATSSTTSVVDTTGSTPTTTSLSATSAIEPITQSVNSKTSTVTTPAAKPPFLR